MFTTWLVRRFAKGVAKTQLNTLRRVQKRNPELTDENLYKRVIALRPGYDAEKVESIIRMTKLSFESFKQTPFHSGRASINFRDVVYTLVVDEYRNAQGRSNHDGSMAAEMLRVVEKVIPSDL